MITTAIPHQAAVFTASFCRYNKACCNATKPLAAALIRFLSENITSQVVCFRSGSTSNTKEAPRLLRSWLMLGTVVHSLLGVNNILTAVAAATAQPPGASQETQAATASGTQRGASRRDERSRDVVLIFLRQPTLMLNACQLAGTLAFSESF